jgi:hypothetical protein
MTAPNLTITVEPSNAGTILYLPLAPKSTNDPARGEVTLALTIHNNEPLLVQLIDLTVSFIGSPAVPAKTISLDLNLPGHGTAGWNFAKANDIVTPFPAPSQIRLSFNCLGFDQPAVLTLPLVAAGPPVPGGFDFPASASDLRIGEYWTGQSLTHDAGANGSQLFAYDMGVVGVNPPPTGFRACYPGPTTLTMRIRASGASPSAPSPMARCWKPKTMSQTIPRRCIGRATPISPPS